MLLVRSEENERRRGPLGWIYSMSVLSKLTMRQGSFDIGFMVSHVVYWLVRIARGAQAGECLHVAAGKGSY